MFESRHVVGLTIILHFLMAVVIHLVLLLRLKILRVWLGRKRGKVVIEIIRIGMCGDMVSLFALVERERGVAILLRH